MYSSFFNYLLVRLPPGLVHLVLRRLSDFACGAAMPSMALEAAAMFKTASVVAPEAAVEVVVLPLMKKLQAEMPETGTQGQGNTAAFIASCHGILPRCCAWHMVNHHLVLCVSSSS
jgi:hypothetical protein